MVVTMGSHQEIQGIIIVFNFKDDKITPWCDGPLEEGQYRKSSVE